MTVWDIMLLCIYIPFGGIRIKKLKPPQKRKDNNMINALKEVSLKSLDMINKNADGLNKLAGFLNDNQNNLNLLATKVLKLEKRIEELETKEYERDLNERPKN